MKLMNLVANISAEQKVKINVPFEKNSYVQCVCYRGTIKRFLDSCGSLAKTNHLEVQNLKCTRKNIISITCMPSVFSDFVGDDWKDDLQC